MITIERKYKFYAAHRNELLQDKCRNLHGHTYRLSLFLTFPDDSSAGGVAMLFADIDKQAMPMITQLDHSLLLNTKDPLHEHLKAFGGMKINSFNFPTSVENIAKALYGFYKDFLPALEYLTLQETDSSIVTYKPF